MGSAKKMFTKLSSAVSGKSKDKGMFPVVEAMTGRTVKSMTDELSAAPERTAAQAGAAAARKRRGGRTGQRGLLYASRLGGGGAGRGEDQTTLGAG
jgi:hypothetical protein